MPTYDVIIIGSGPAGIFAALELVKNADLRILMIEKGSDLDQRSCPMVESSVACVHCGLCSILCGWGGAGAYSDGKLTLTSEFGGWLKDYLSDNDLAGFIEHVDSVYRSFGASGEVHGEDSEALARFKKKAAGYNLELIPARIRHIGTDLCKDVLRNIRRHLDGKIDVVFDLPVARVDCKEGALCGVIAEDGTRFDARAVIAAVGREGSAWLSSEAKRLGLSVRKNPVDIGVRVELPAHIMKEITDIAYEGKFIYSSRRFRDRVRTFCMNPYGVVVKENADGIASVNGHSYKNRRTANTNFALLVSTDFTKPFDDPISYGRYIAGLANLLGGGALVQRLGDLKMGRRSTPERIAEGSVRPTLADATPGDLSFVLPYRHLHNITGNAGSPGQYRARRQFRGYSPVRSRGEVLFHAHEPHAEPGDRGEELLRRGRRRGRDARTDPGVYIGGCSCEGSDEEALSEADDQSHRGRACDRSRTWSRSGH